MNNYKIALSIKGFFRLTLLLLWFTHPVAVLAQSPELGSSTFYTDVKAWMTAHSRNIFLGSYGVSNFVVFDADGYKLSTYKAAHTGDTIDDAVSANPDAEIILNGALFNYKEGGPSLTPGAQAEREWFSFS